MLKSLASFALLLPSVALMLGATEAQAASSNTDFGVRTIGVRTTSGQITSVVTNSTSRALLVASNPSLVRSSGTMDSYASPPAETHWGVNLRAAAAFGAAWGRVTSTIRSVAHNRAVGGVANSWHLKGRAIDIARRPGVTHAQIAAAFRNAGYRLIESLDEGDHSHFAFGGGGSELRYAAAPRAPHQGTALASTEFKIVTVASALLK